MSARMTPMRDATGALRPDLDYRLVPAGVMAAYLGVSRMTFYRRWMDGLYPNECAVKRGRLTYFHPRRLLGIEGTAHVPTP